MTDTNRTPEKDAILDARLALESWDRGERLALLAAHVEERHRRQAELQARCSETVGHEMKPIIGERGRPHWITGKIPTHCIWCGMEGYEE